MTMGSELLLDELDELWLDELELLEWLEELLEGLDELELLEDELDELWLEG